MASVLEVNDKGERFFNVFEAAPENSEHREAVAQQHDKGVVVEYFL